MINLTVKDMKRYRPTKEATLAWDVIQKAGAVKKFVRLMNKWYDKGITFEDVNDQLQFEHESVIAELDI